MRVLLFGPTGQVGREILERAPAGGVTVAAADRAVADLADPESLRRVIDAAEVDAVINAAAWTAVDLAETEEAAALAANGVAPGVMARACAARDLPFLHVSTDYVFDGAPGRPWREDDPVAPVNAYGRTKLAGERAVADAGGRWLTVRTSWVFSPHGRNFVKTMLSLAAREQLTVVDDQYGRPTAAGDIAEVLLAAAARMVSEPDGPVGGLLHFAGEEATTWRGFAEAVFAASQGPRPRVVGVTTAEYPTPARRPANSVLDCARYEALFGAPPRSWRAGLDETIAALGAESGACREGS